MSHYRGWRNSSVTVMRDRQLQQTPHQNVWYAEAWRLGKEGIFEEIRTIRKLVLRGPLIGI